MDQTTEMLQPRSPHELCALVEEERSLLPVGGRSKPALSSGKADSILIDVSQLTGVLEYTPEEYTITAQTGTPVKEVIEVLHEHGQYLPFDPPFAEAGATLGGTIAAGLSGVGRQRFGGVRDFILGVRLVSGMGEIITGGGKVVKNAAGFDIPKLMVGSLGRLGVLTEVTFKVFPRPQAFAMGRLQCRDFEEAVRTLVELNSRPFDLEGLELVPPDSVLVRIGGIREAFDVRLRNIEETLSIPMVRLSESEETDILRDLRNFSWRPDHHGLAKIAISPGRIDDLYELFQSINCPCRFGGGGCVAWVAYPHVEARDRLCDGLRIRNLAGLLLIGENDSPLLGNWEENTFLKRIRAALDPEDRFAAW